VAESSGVKQGEEPRRPEAKITIPEEAAKEAVTEILGEKFKEVEHRN